MDPKHPGKAVEVVLLRLWVFKQVQVDTKWDVELRTIRFPAIRVVGYQSSSGSFDRHLPDFEAFLGQFRFKASGKNTPSSSTPAPRTVPARRAQPPTSAPPSRKANARPQPAAQPRPNDPH